MFRHTDPEVLVVGAGPVGLVAALFLQQHGVRCRSSTRISGRPSQLRARDPSAHAPGSRGGRTRRRTDRRGSEADEDRLLRRTGEARRDRLFGPRFQSPVSPRPPAACWRRRRGGAPPAEAQGPLGTSSPVPQRGRRDPAGGGGDARPGRERLPRRAKRVGRRAKRDHPASLCHRRRRVRLGRAADGRHRHGLITARARSSPSTNRGGGELPAEVRVILDRDLTSVYWPLEEGRCRWGSRLRTPLVHHDIAGAARAADRREGSLIHGAADADSLVDARPVREPPDAELRQRGVWLAGTPRTRRLRSARTA